MAPEERRGQDEPKDSGAVGASAPEPEPNAAARTTDSEAASKARQSVRTGPRAGFQRGAFDGAAISPRMRALFGGLFGLGSVASIFALLIQVFPIAPDARTAVSNAPQTAASAAELAPSGRPRPPKRVRELLAEPWRVEELRGTHVVVRDEMKRRSFLVALAELRVPKSESYRILKAMDGVFKLDQPKRRHKLIVALERATKKVVAFEYEVSSTEIYQGRTSDAGLLEVKRLDLAVKHEEFAAAAYLGKDLSQSLENAGFEPGLAAVINEAFIGQTSVEAFEEGGVLKALVTETTALGRFVSYERIRALEYRPPDPSKPPVRAYWFEGATVKGYTDERGRRPSNAGWRTPCPGSPVTSHFNPKRMHPVLKKVMPHNGTDFGAPTGTPVFAAFRGKVSFIGDQGPSGNLVLLEHGGAIQTGYAHLSRFAPGVKNGDQIGTRELIGYVGSTGRSTGPHLHFSARRDGKFFDPLELRLDALQLLPTEERVAFLAQKQALDRVLEAIPLPEPPEPTPVPAMRTTLRAAGGDAGDSALAGSVASAQPNEARGGEAADRELGGDEPRAEGGDASGDGDASAKTGPKGAETGAELLGEDLSGAIE